MDIDVKYIISSKSLLLFPLFLSSLVLLLECISSFPSVPFRHPIDPPLLELLSVGPNIYGQHSVDVETNSTLKLRCNGSHPFRWVFPKTLYDVPGNEGLSSVVTECSLASNRADQRDRNALSCTSCLTLMEVASTETGLFTCHYNGSEPTDPSKSASVYVFVNEPYNLLVPFFDQDMIFAPLVQKEPATIPCKPTNSKANVTIVNNNTGKAVKVGAQFGVAYDPREGFHFLRPVWDPMSLDMNCRATVGNVTEEIPIKTYLTFPPSSRLFPEIDDQESQYYFINGTLRLTCTVAVEVGVLVGLSWHSPRQRYSRSGESGVSVQRIGDESYFFHNFVKNLTVTSLEKEDEGWYTCNVTDVNGKAYIARRLVSVLNPSAYPALSLDFKPHFDVNLPFEASVDQRVEFVVELRVVPAFLLRSIRFKWLKNGEGINTNRISGALRGSSAVLTINPVFRSDGGRYTLIAESANVHKSFTLALRVFSPVPVSYDIMAAIAFAACVSLGVIAVVIMYFVKRQPVKGGDEKGFVVFTPERDNNANYQPLELNPSLPLDEQTEALPYNNKWEYPVEKVRLDCVIGQGEFGCVMKATIDDPQGQEMTVAVKKLKQKGGEESLSASERKALKDELKIMMYIGSHENIVNLIGAVSAPSPMIIIEFCPFGSLRQVLSMYKKYFVQDLYDPQVTPGSHEAYAWPRPLEGSVGSRSYADPTYFLTCLTQSNSDLSAASDADRGDEDEQEPTLTTSTLIYFGLQVATGMQFLASHKCIHRDIAARNVLLTHNNVVKICDFGLTKNCYHYDTVSYLRKTEIPLPIKWMAIESIRDNVFTTKTDVWSFGIFLWELFSLGGDPYPGISLTAILEKLVEGHRLARPEHCPQFIYDVMEKCWIEDEAIRPDFEAMVGLFHNMIGRVNNLYVKDRKPSPWMACPPKCMNTVRLDMTGPQPIDRLYTNILDYSAREGNPEGYVTRKDCSHGYDLPPIACPRFLLKPNTFFIEQEPHNLVVNRLYGLE